MTIALGLLEWFRPGQEQHVEQVLQDLARLGVQKLRTGVSWADYHTEEGRRWYQWLLPRLARDVEILPCFLYTPPSLGLRPKASSPPRQPKAYADWLDTVITDHGKCFEFVELWNEPNNLSEWDWTLDPNWMTFCQMVGGAAYWARTRGKKTVLGGMAPMDPQWLELMIERGVIEHMDVVGVHAFPALWEAHWPGWTAQLQPIQQVLWKYRCKSRVWISETGYSTWRHDEFKQVQAFLEALEAPVERLYWYAVRDLHPDHNTVDGFHTDEREYHLGVKKADGTPKLLYKSWAAGGLGGVRNLYELARPRSRPDLPAYRPVLVTGGAGFVGSRLCERLVKAGSHVIVYDNLSRTGAEQNLHHLKERYWPLVDVRVADLLDPYALRAALASAKAVFHLAADLVNNDNLHLQLLPTLNLLDLMINLETPPPLISVSGRASDTTLTPRRVSRTALERYVISYARTHRLPAAVLRFSRLYGPGMAPSAAWRTDQLLHVDDAVDAMLAAMKAIERLRGRVFNVPGTSPRTTADLSGLLREYGIVPAQQSIDHVAPRHNAFTRQTGWSPRIPLDQGIRSLQDQGIRSLQDQGIRSLHQQEHLRPPEQFIPEKGGRLARSRR